MSKDKIFIFDLEGDGVNPSKIHCLVVAYQSDDGWVQYSTTDYNKMRSFFMKKGRIFIGHNIARWDIPVVERILGIKVSNKIVDTLPLSWYLYSNKLKHGLDDWGTEFGIPKPKITQGEWEGPLEGETKQQFIDKMLHRCREDVKINCKLWDKQIKDLTNLYEKADPWAIINYIMFKIDCARKAEESRWKLDVARCEEALASLEADKASKLDTLIKAMPKVPVIKVVSKPSKMYKKNGDMAVAGVKWFELLKEQGLDSSNSEDVSYVSDLKLPNPTSVQQKKSWLFSLGWKPQTFKYVKDSDDSGRSFTRKVEQIYIDRKGEKMLCPSVKSLQDKEPAIEALEGLTILTHRIAILAGYLKNVDDEGYLKAQISGLTNTLRFKHKTIVNLPSVSKPYGDIVRGVLIAPEGYELCGSDMSSLEDRTKQHYMWDYDADYVKEMQTDDFDPHLDLCVLAGFLTQEQADMHKSGEAKFSSERSLGKTANYACVYGASGKTVARSSGGKMTNEEGNKLVEKYWERNWAVKAIADDCVTKPCLKQNWLWNPVSKFWYSLRYDKDRFSTLNQGTAVYCFDMWIQEFFKRRPQITGQMHDEVILCIKKGFREQCAKLLKDSIHSVNEQLNLNRSLDVDVQFGDTYADIH
ncbi:MAG: hypothetical protein HRU18_03685 [Pseudoalteromonas sp.]|uniref:DNA polymerase n=1 Tax=Pseudoalteromonas sp. TaxID=53249 RepID=UPI001DC05CBA|nr:DNA polymerase [Pseudoalteromonas sp.]NRA77288.1 hypothetical protein [Pseudoalteromonas sp.]